MPANVQFLLERNVLYFVYQDPLSLADIESSLAVFPARLEQATAPLHSIFDVTRLTLLPPKVLSTFMAKRALYEAMLIHPRRGVSLIVTGSSLISAVVNIAAQYFATEKVMVMRTLADAWSEIDRLNS